MFYAFALRLPPRLFSRNFSPGVYPVERTGSSLRKDLNISGKTLLIVRIGPGGFRNCFRRRKVPGEFAG